MWKVHFFFKILYRCLNMMPIKLQSELNFKIFTLYVKLCLKKYQKQQYNSQNYQISLFFFPKTWNVWILFQMVEIFEIFNFFRSFSRFQNCFNKTESKVI